LPFNLKIGDDGHVLPGPGRPKGLKSKPVALNMATLNKKLKELDFDSIEEFVALYRHPDTTQISKVELLKTIFKHTVQMSKAVEHSGSVESRHLNINMNIGNEPLPSLDHAQTVDITVEPTVADTIDDVDMEE
jgi:hypothetical protein